jgi:CheY-like chemotaxis protein
VELEPVPGDGDVPGTLGLLQLDLHLPDMPGQEVLRRLRAEARTANVPVVILSADARPALVNELLVRGYGRS